MKYSVVFCPLISSLDSILLTAHSSHNIDGFAHLITSCFPHQKLIAFSEITVSQIFKQPFLFVHLKWRKLKWKSIDNSATFNMINLIEFKEAQRVQRWGIARNKSVLREEVDVIIGHLVFLWDA